MSSLVQFNQPQYQIPMWIGGTALVARYTLPTIASSLAIISIFSFLVTPFSSHLEKNYNMPMQPFLQKAHLIDKKHPLLKYVLIITALALAVFSSLLAFMTSLITGIYLGCLLSNRDEKSLSTNKVRDTLTEL